jgi:hypothetical protein
VTLPNTRIFPWLIAVDYDAIRQLSPDDPDLPPTFNEWLELANEQLSVFRKSGIPVQKVEIISHELKAYCDKCGIHPDAVGRSGFAVHKSDKTDCYRLPEKDS